MICYRFIVILVLTATALLRGQGAQNRAGVAPLPDPHSPPPLARPAAPANAPAKPPVDAIAEPLVKSVAEISAKNDPSAKDYARMADATIDFARRKTQANEPLNRNVIESGIDAVDAGEAHDVKAANWPKMRDELKAFLEEKDKEKPPPQDNKDQNKDQNKDKQSGDGEKNQDDPSSKKDSSDQEKNPDGSPKNDQQKDQSNGSPEKSPSSSEQDQKKGEPKDGSSDKPSKDPASAFGDMNEQRPQKPPEETASETQKVGGQPKKESAQNATADPLLAVPLQKLDQLKQQDSPAKLFRLMEGQRGPTPAKKGKDW